MRLVNATVLSALMLSVATMAMADCAYPKRPGTAPDGGKASKEEMIAASKAVRQFDADVKNYQICLDGEKEAMTKALGDKGTPEAIKRINDIQNQKSNTAATEAAEVVDAFNSQLRIFKARP